MENLEARINSAKHASTRITSEVTGGRFSAHVVSVKTSDLESRIPVSTTHQSLELILSNVVPQITFRGETKDVSINASAIICDGGVGRLYHSRDESKLKLSPFLCADIEIIINSYASALREDVYPEDQGLSFYFHMGERELYYILHLLCTANLCVATVEAELCMIDDQKYIIVNRNQHIQPTLQFKFLTQYLGLHLSSSEIAAMMSENIPIIPSLKR